MSRRTKQQAAARAGRVRVPPQVTEALTDMQRAYRTGTDTDYDDAVARLSAACADLSPEVLELVNAHIARAHAQLAEQDRLAAARAALAGPWESVAALPGCTELVRLTAADVETLATVPAVQDGDSESVQELVREARQALLDARCARCGGKLGYRLDGNLCLTHRWSCRLAEQSIASRRADSGRRSH